MGEQQNIKRANASTGKGERGSPEQNEHEYEQKQKPISIKVKQPQATSYEQQRNEQRLRAAMREKSFPTPLSGERFRAKKQETLKQLADFARKREV